MGEEIGDKVFVGYINQIGAGINPETGEVICTEKLRFVLTYYYENPQPLVVLGFFKGPLYAGLDIFTGLGIRCGIITGDQDDKEVDDTITKFQTNKIDILFGQTDKIKMGHDFSRASVTFFISNSFSSGTRGQAEMRTTRMDKATPSEIIDICTDSTLDEIIVDSLFKKEALSSDILSNHVNPKEWNYGE